MSRKTMTPAQAAEFKARMAAGRAAKAAAGGKAPARPRKTPSPPPPAAAPAPRRAPAAARPVSIGDLKVKPTPLGKSEQIAPTDREIEAIALHSLSAAKKVVAQRDYIKRSDARRERLLALARKGQAGLAPLAAGASAVGGALGARGIRFAIDRYALKVAEPHKLAVTDWRRWAAPVVVVVLGAGTAVAGARNDSPALAAAGVGMATEPLLDMAYRFVDRVVAGTGALAGLEEPQSIPGIGFVPGAADYDAAAAELRGLLSA